VAESLQPGVRVADIARRHGLIPHQPSDWRRHARQGLLSLPADLLPALPQPDEGSAEPAFVPLAIAPDARAALNAPPVGFAIVMQFLSLKIESLLAIIEAKLNLANPTPPRVLCYAKIILLKSVGEHGSMS
jgi:hypothetical protein